MTKDGTRTGSVDRDVANPHQAPESDLQRGTGQAAMEAAAMGAATYLGLQLGKGRSPYLRSLPISMQSLLIAGPPAVWFMYSNVTSSRNLAVNRHHASTPAPTHEDVFSSGADMTHSRKAMNLPLQKRAGLWMADNPLTAATVAGAPIIGYVAYSNYKHPNMALTQRIMRTSVLGQMAVLTSLAGVLGFSYLYEGNLPDQAKATMRKHMTQRIKRDNAAPDLSAEGPSRTSVTVAGGPRSDQQQQTHDAAH